MSSRPQPQPAPPLSGERSELDLAQFEGFTPGPWTLGWRLLVIMGNGKAVATVRCDSQHPATEDGAHADAALIAAAPALLAECQRLRAREAALVSALTFAQTEYTGAGVTAAMMRERLKIITEAARAALQSDASGQGVA